MELQVVPIICSKISRQSIELTHVTYEHLIELELADQTSGSSELHIDILIGGNFYWRFMKGDVRKGTSGPVAINTILGWVLSGPCDWSQNYSTSNFVSSSHVLVAVHSR